MTDVPQWVANGGSLLAVIWIWVIATREYPSLPARFPAHFGITGRPDRWGTRRLVWLLPVVSTVAYFGLEFVIHDPHGAAVAPLVAWLRFEMFALYLFIETRSIAVARGRAAGLGVAFLPVTLLVIIGTWLLLRPA